MGSHSRTRLKRLIKLPSAAAAAAAVGNRCSTKSPGRIYVEGIYTGSRLSYMRMLISNGTAESG